MDLSGKRVAVVGLGASGASAARLCLARGAQVIGLDEAPRDKLGALPEGLTVACGPLAAERFDGVDLVVISPGMPQREAIAAVERRGTPVIGELELASRFLTAPIVLVGGTNGKSTVTALSAAMLEADARRVFVGGNYGTPLCEAVGQDWDALVVEISSFQAERVPSLHARVHVLLNITEDHLDRYDSFAAYANAKGNPFASMVESDAAVVPAGDRACLEQAKRGRARLIEFSSEDGRGAISPRGAALVDRTRGDAYPIASLKLRGRHNLANACAAIAVAGDLGVSARAIGATLAAFAGLDHRCVLVAEIGGVRFYDDSKGTNVGASVAALAGLEEPRAVLIAGGRDKLGDYAPLCQALRDKGRALVVIGEAAERIAAAAAGIVPIERAGSMADAVARAAALAEPGDAVLLSPACSSFDMFQSYKQRGDVFAAEVKALAGSTA